MTRPAYGKLRPIAPRMLESPPQESPQSPLSQEGARLLRPPLRCGRLCAVPPSAPPPAAAWARSRARLLRLRPLVPFRPAVARKQTARRRPYLHPLAEPEQPAEKDIFRRAGKAPPMAKAPAMSPAGSSKSSEEAGTMAAHCAAPAPAPQGAAQGRPHLPRRPACLVILPPCAIQNRLGAQVAQLVEHVTENHVVQIRPWAPLVCARAAPRDIRSPDTRLLYTWLPCTQLP